MKRNNRLFDYCLLIIALISFLYFIILITNSRIIKAYIFYPLVTLFCSTYSLYELHNKTSLLSKLPKIVNYGFKIIMIIVITTFITIEGLIIHEANNKYDKKCDFIIVLGNRLYGNTPSPLLKCRLEAAYKYHQKFPNTPIIVSGGKGNGENISEAKAMKNYLMTLDIEDNIIIEEDKSTNTNENIKYSKKIIETLTDKNYDIVIVTNGFHCYRGKLLAKKYNLNAHTYGAKEHFVVTPHYYIREFFGCLKDMLLSK